MKKIIQGVVILFFGLATVKSQETGKIKVNAGLAYGTEVGIDGGGLGINLGGEYFITDEISAAPSYSSFFEDSEGPVSANFSAVNIDGRYYFLNDDFYIYGLLGLSILSFDIETPLGPFGSIESSDSETGLNVGGGIVYPLDDQFDLNGQLKYQTPGDGQIVLNLSLVFNIN